MDYQEFIEKQREEYPVLDEIAEILDAGEKKNILVYSHDDPDGVVAATILSRYRDRAGHDYQVELPHTFELETNRVKNLLEEKNEQYDAMFILDKGTLAQYDELTEVIDSVVVVDHHYTSGEPENCLLYNPDGGCCTGLQSHMLVNLVDETDGLDDFLALVALRSDWTIMPMKGVIPDFVKPFFEEVKEEWANLLEPFAGRPTWMEIDQREQTLLLNQISELYFAVSGGGFQYFYGDRDEELAEIDATELCFEEMLALAGNLPQLKEIESLDEMIALSERDDLVERICTYFKSDWEWSLELFESAFLYGRFGPVDVYLFTGEDTPLMPMVGSVKLGKISRQNDDKPTIMVMVNNQRDGGGHFSFRAVGDKIHLGRIADVLSNELAEEYGEPDMITGGGHPFAAEVKIFLEDIEMAIPITRLFEHLNKLYEFAQDAEAGELDDSELEEAVELGLSYLET